VNAPIDDRHPIAIAAQWVSQITAVAFEIVLPVVVGKWLDQKWGTSYWTLIGAAIGPPVGFYHLLTLTGVLGGVDSGSDKSEKQ
jgi:uncharacterized protein YqgC (DUF456 family)